MSKRYNPYVTVRLSEELKRDFESFCSNSGMTVGGVVNLLISRTIRKQAMPFRIAETEDLEVRGRYQGGEKQAERINVRVDKEVREQFAAVCQKIGIRQSRLIKVFMVYCVKKGKIPF